MNMEDRDGTYRRRHGEDNALPLNCDASQSDGIISYARRGLFLFRRGLTRLWMVAHQSLLGSQMQLREA